MIKLEGKNIVGNVLSAEGSKTFYAVNPSTKEKIEPAFHEATAAEIDKAIQSAHEAFQLYRNITREKKAEFLTCIGDEIMALGDQLIKRSMEETGLAEARLIGERARTVNQLYLFASLVKEGSWVDARIDTADPNRKPTPKPDLRSMQKALGPVGVFGASNFPMAYSVAGGDTTSALAAGCPVIIKAHPAHPGACELVAQAILNAIKKCNMPDGTFSMVHGQTPDTGLAIVRHPLIKAIGFTGSFKGGKALFDEANKRPEPIPVYAEMGSTNPVFILSGALKERGTDIARDFAAEVALGVGQFCTNPGLVILPPSDLKKEFVANVSKHIEETAAGVMLTEGIRNNFQQGVSKLQSSSGVKEVSSGKKSDAGYTASAHLFETDIKNFLSNPVLEEEVFGPSTLAITTGNKIELIEAAKKLHGHLTASVIGTPQDLEEHRELINILEQKAGRLIINGYPTGVEVNHAMVHGGPFPATTDSRTTSVGTSSITRFSRPVCYQNFPDTLLPDELKENNPLGIWRLYNGERIKK